MKKFLLFLFGVFVGIVLTIGYYSYSGSSSSSSTDDSPSIAKYPGVSLFEEPGNVLNFKSFEVFHVLENGAALANGSSNLNEPYYNIHGTVVLLLPGEPYFDDQIIKVPSGKRVRQIGTYRYTTKLKEVKTVPIVELFDQK